MPVEYSLLKDRAVPIGFCPKCGTIPFRPFLRGDIQSQWRKWLRRPYCCLICTVCKEIVGYEKP